METQRIPIWNDPERAARVLAQEARKDAAALASFTLSVQRVRKAWLDFVEATLRWARSPEGRAFLAKDKAKRARRRRRSRKLRRRGRYRAGKAV